MTVHAGVLACVCVMVCTLAQSGVLALTGAGVGGGFGVATWQPFLCLLFAHDPASVYWTQLGILLVLLPAAAVAATLSLLFSRALWKGARAGDDVL